MRRFELGALTDGELADELYAAGAEVHELPDMIGAIRGVEAFDDGDSRPFASARAALFRAKAAITLGDLDSARVEVDASLRAARSELVGAVAVLVPDLAVELEERWIALRAQLDRKERREDLIADVAILSRSLTKAQLSLAGEAPAPPKLGARLVVPERATSDWIRAVGAAALRAGVVPAVALGLIALRAASFRPRLRAALIAVGIVVLLPAIARWIAIAAALAAHLGVAVVGLALGAGLSVAIALALGFAVRRSPGVARLAGIVGAAILAAWLAGQVVGELELRGVIVRRLLGFVGAPGLSIYPSVVAVAVEVAVAALILAVALRPGAPPRTARRSAREQLARGRDA